jgi:2-desacetyl-2-hydroxyethyl bacteriochlorophyllide A dehydrogenase
MLTTHIAQITSPGQVSFYTEDVGAPDPGQVLLQALYSTLSPGTEYDLMAGQILPLPQKLGYSLAAKVVDVGKGVESIKVGDKVVATAAHASYQLLDWRALTPVPEGVDLQQAAFFNLAHTALYAIRRSGLQLGEACVVMGQGLVGALTAQLARLAGAIPVIVTDVDETRLAIARSMGVQYAVNPLTEPHRLQQLVAELGGVPVVFEATGRREPLDQAFDLVAERGRVVMMSQSQDKQLPDYAHRLMMKGATLIGGYINSKPFALYRSDIEITDQWPPTMRSGLQRYGHSDCWSSDEDIRVILKLLRSGSLDIGPLISHHVDWQQLPDIYQRVWNREPALLGGLICW